MGGRGANFRIIARLPSYEKAVIPYGKIERYLLKPDKGGGKASFFHSLGYNMKNKKRFKIDILEQLRKNKALEYTKDEYGGVAYQVDMVLGINKKRMVKTGWYIGKGERFPRLVTAYPNKKAGKS